MSVQWAKPSALLIREVSSQMISQLSVFLQNEKGHLAKLCNKIADMGINMHAMFLADTQDFGIARIFCDKPEETCMALSEDGFKASITPICAVRIPDEPGGLAKLLTFCDDNDMNIQYGYCFQVADKFAIDVLKIDDSSADEKMIQAGFTIVEPEEIYSE